MATDMENDVQLTEQNSEAVEEVKELENFEVNGNTSDEDVVFGIPRKRNAAWIRLTIASALAVLILCLTGFGGIKILTGGKELTKDNIKEGNYLSFNVDTILDYLAEDYVSDTDTVVGRYAIVPVDGCMTIVHFPQRYLDSADTIAMQTYYVLYGYMDTDAYFCVSGTVKRASDELAEKYADWYNNNAAVMYYYGLVDELEDPDTIADNLYYIDVESTGLFNDTVCSILSFVSIALIIYALIVLVRIKMGKYDKQDIEVEIIEDFDENSGLATIPAEEIDNEEEKIAEGDHTDEL